MDFTREPIIETIITPKEGCKLVIRNSKVSGAEEYSVDALEVVNFGSTPFYRSLERPKAFLVPVTDYEVVEVREMRVPLKNASFDRTIKINSKKETKPTKGNPKSKVKPEEEAKEEESDEPKKKRSRRRSRRSKSDESDSATESENAGSVKNTQSEGEKNPDTSKPAAEKADSSKESAEKKSDEAAPRPMKTRLVPPPTTLISETISRYKNILMNEEKADRKKPPGLPKELLEESDSKATATQEEE